MVKKLLTNQHYEHIDLIQLCNIINHRTELNYYFNLTRLLNYRLDTLHASKNCLEDAAIIKFSVCTNLCPITIFMELLTECQ